VEGVGTPRALHQVIGDGEDDGATTDGGARVRLGPYGYRWFRVGPKVAGGDEHDF
jgi:hypothetical protein